MAKQVKIYCKNLNRDIVVNGGDTLEDIYRGISEEIATAPICALVNNEICSLNYAIYAPRQVEFLDSCSRLGSRVYLHTLCMVLYKAVTELYPELHLRIEHSVSGGIYCKLYGDADVEVTDEVVAKLRDKMKSITEADMPIECCEERTSDVVERLKAQGIHDKAEMLASTHNLYTMYYDIDGTIDTYFNALAPSTGAVKVFGLEQYKDGMLLLPQDVKNPAEPCKMVGQDKVFNAFIEYIRLNEVLGIKNVAELNQAVADSHDIRMLINVAETIHESRFAKIAQEIAERHRNGGARVVLLAGPSSSGKTTSSKRLAVQLIANQIVPKIISLDNYFINRDDTPLDEYGEKDFESLYALDLPKFNADLNDLIAGKEVAMPTYNFEKGMREYRGDTLKLEENNILLLEGIHGLNPELTASIPSDQKFLLYASALSTINIDDHNWLSTSDNRLLRRIIRDHKYRGTSAQDTIARWPSVRRGEEKWIFPYQENADAIFNSSLIFELGVMRIYGEEILRQVPCDVPEYAEASRLLKLLSCFAPISASSVPGNSLLREFLGGSIFRY